MHVARAATAVIAAALIGASAAQAATYPAAGVMAASPATAPVARPTPEGFPRRNHSTAIQTTMPADAPNWVFTSALVATGPALPALPALNPNHPNQRIPAPSRTSGTL